MLHGGMHHLHTKRRPSTPRTPWKRWLDSLMVLVGFLSPLALLPQVIDIWSTGNVDGLALLTWVMLATFNALWALYGYVHKVYPVMISSAAFSCLQISIVTAILLFS